MSHSKMPAPKVTAPTGSLAVVKNFVKYLNPRYYIDEATGPERWIPPVCVALVLAGSVAYYFKRNNGGGSAFNKNNNKCPPTCCSTNNSSTTVTQQPTTPVANAAIRRSSHNNVITHAQAEAAGVNACAPPTHMTPSKYARGGAAGAEWGDKPAGEAAARGEGQVMLTVANRGQVVIGRRSEDGVTFVDVYN